MGVWGGDSTSNTTVNNTPTDEQIRRQNEGELLTGLMNSGKIDFFDITNDDLRKESLDALQDLEGNLANPFPSFLDDTGKLLIDDILAATDSVADFGTRYKEAKTRLAPLVETADRQTDLIAGLYDEDGVEADYKAQNETFREINEGLKELSLDSAALDKTNQEAVLKAGSDYATSLGETGQGAEELIRERGKILTDNAAGAESLINERQDVLLENAANMEGLIRDREDVLLQNAGDVGDMMRRNAFTQRRASEDAANQALRGLRGLGIGQGTGTNMRSAMIQNRAQQAQDMAEPMGLADLFQASEQADVQADAISQIMQARDRGDMARADTIGDIIQARERGDFSRADTISDIITAQEGRDLANVSSKEAALNNELRRLGYSDPEIQADIANLGLDMTSEEDSRNLYRDLKNERFGNLGLSASQVELLKYLASADDDLAFAETDGIARRSEPYTARGTTPAPSGAYFSQAYTAPTAGRSTFDKVSDVYNFINGNRR